ncbi:hypothetical protein HaLaN_27205, partial [Haematococcus lacustris]
GGAAGCAGAAAGPAHLCHAGPHEPDTQAQAREHAGGSAGCHRLGPGAAHLHPARPAA